MNVILRTRNAIGRRLERQCKHNDLKVEVSTSMIKSTDAGMNSINDRMIEELQAGSACDCTKNTSWKDKRLHCAVRRSLRKTLDVQFPQGSGTRHGAATLECHGSIECTGTDVEICLMSDVQCGLESSSGSHSDRSRRPSRTGT